MNNITEGDIVEKPKPVNNYYSGMGSDTNSFSDNKQY
jgi:hypothetical protein